MNNPTFLNMSLEEINANAKLLDASTDFDEVAIRGNFLMQYKMQKKENQSYNLVVCDLCSSNSDTLGGSIFYEDIPSRSAKFGPFTCICCECMKKLDNYNINHKPSNVTQERARKLEMRIEDQPEIALNTKETFRMNILRFKRSLPKKDRKWRIFMQEPTSEVNTIITNDEGNVIIENQTFHDRIFYTKCHGCDTVFDEREIVSCARCDIFEYHSISCRNEHMQQHKRECEAICMDVPIESEEHAKELDIINKDVSSPSLNKIEPQNPTPSVLNKESVFRTIVSSSLIYKAHKNIILEGKWKMRIYKDDKSSHLFYSITDIVSIIINSKDTAKIGDYLVGIMVDQIRTITHNSKVIIVMSKKELLEFLDKKYIICPLDIIKELRESIASMDDLNNKNF